MIHNNTLIENIRILTQVTQTICEENYLEKATTIPLSRNQFFVLTILYMSGTKTLSKLAEILKISNAAAGKNIEKLLSHQLIERKNPVDDRRTLNITILSKGKRIVEKYQDVKESYQNSTLLAFSDDEKKLFTQLIRKYIRNSIHPEENLDLICLLCNGTCGEECVIKSCKGLCSRHPQREDEEAK
ncbi:MAG: MarR family transcriptional regulator [Candidatus Marinimicrobia bacterium]|nr:MarR family transcriptional regulator [Candidatus Neomarinimicrobiota bacterium]MBL7022486.1 MarR family transcriptional regulator [Candidatus Neomarinimicrobiota bacterium]MBL7108659.1 MarR family transcriptional regulator [Candidatus Neomarinimicrobiota bacterium]